MATESECKAITARLDNVEKRVDNIEQIAAKAVKSVGMAVFIGTLSARLISEIGADNAIKIFQVIANSGILK